jgi:hypothetical protein
MLNAQCHNALALRLPANTSRTSTSCTERERPTEMKKEVVILPVLATREGVDWSRSLAEDSYCLTSDAEKRRIYKNRSTVPLYNIQFPHKYLDIKKKYAIS